jgi:hypothetical protein
MPLIESISTPMRAANSIPLRSPRPSIVSFARDAGAGDRAVVDKRAVAGRSPEIEGH